MAHHQQDERRRSALQSLLNMFHLSRTVSSNNIAEDEVEGDVDEPPDERSLAGKQTITPLQDSTYAKCAPPPMERKVSLITRALRSAQGSEAPSPVASPVSAAFSRTSTFSNASVPSTAELTSDGDDKSPARSISSSPPLPTIHVLPLGHTGNPLKPPSRISFAGEKEAVHPAPKDSHESQIEANLGRKRLITFACSEKPTPKSPVIPPKEEKKETTEPPKRKCMLTFACPARPSQPAERAPKNLSPRRESQLKLPGDIKISETKPPVTASIKSPAGLLATSHNDLLSPPLSSKATSVKSPEVPVFQEFDVSNDDAEEWAREPIDSGHKLILSDLMQKENAIRKLGEEAEEEAEEEEKAEEEAANEIDDLDDGDNDDDFAPSDDGNESDNEAGFAESDDEADAHPDDQFWVPRHLSARSNAVQTSYFRSQSSRRHSGSSTDSLEHRRSRRARATPSINIKHSKNNAATKMRPLRPSTPDLPDSTDFVCGTLDEDRPLEAAYKSCLEHRKREKLIPIPQDIDPSFPTSDPEDMDEEDDEDLDIPDDDVLPDGQIEGLGESDADHLTPHVSRRSSVKSPRRPRSPIRQAVHRSPPPPRAITRHISPPPKGRLFGKSPRRLISPPPTTRLRSPPGTRRESSTELTPFPQLTKGLATGRLAHRPSMNATSSLPRTPNPFFHNYRAGKHGRSRATSDDSTPRSLHIRGPVDIVTGLETKRQKRKEKFWRQHCRKAAREQMERKIVPGRGAERMRELGLECAERNRAYGVQQQALVISL